MEGADDPCTKVLYKEVVVKITIANAAKGISIYQRNWYEW